MKKDLEIPASYIKELWSLYEDEAQDEQTFQEFLYCEYATDPTMHSSLEIGGFCPYNENVEEYENMSDEEQDKEIEVRFMFFIKKCEEVLGREFKGQTFEEIKTNATKILGY